MTTTTYRRRYVSLPPRWDVRVTISGHGDITWQQRQPGNFGGCYLPYDPTPEDWRALVLRMAYDADSINEAIVETHNNLIDDDRAGRGAKETLQLLAALVDGPVCSDCGRLFESTAEVHDGLCHDCAESTQHDACRCGRRDCGDCGRTAPIGPYD